MKKKLIATNFAAAALSLGVLSGCFSQTVSIQSIEKTNTVGLVDYYTITYTDGTTSGFTVTNGKDGSDAQDVTAEDVYNTYKSIYPDEDITFKQFCEMFLASDVSGDSTAALNSCLRSCLKVYSGFREREYTYAPIKTACYCGSAVVYKMDETYTYILTNYHVVYDSKAVGTNKISEEISAYLYGSESAPTLDSSDKLTYDEYAIKCEYIGGSINYDVAVIRAKTDDVKKVNPQVVPVTVNTSFSVGDSTYAVGNPDDGGISVTEGIVSVDSDYVLLAIDGTDRYYRSIRTDTALTHGNSGGGLFNMNGELIGLNNAGDTDITSMNYAIPATALTGIADGVIHYYNLSNGKVKTPSKTVIGVKSQQKNSRYIYDELTQGGYIREDVTISEVTKNSLASLMGLKVDDVITSLTIAGKKTEITRQFQISDLLLNAREGDLIKVGYTRGGVAAETEAVAVRSSDLQNVDKAA